ncbi:MAG: hypothetical protein PHY93_10380 [Bacteriovorax sp.]|nr:hypothetical protein [Bacteriovorax sp.]
MRFQRILAFIFLGLLSILGSGCKAKTSSTPAKSVPPVTTGGSIHITGTLTYDFVSAASGKLNYTGTIQKPMRNVFVELLNAADDSVVSSTSSSDSGAYDFAITASANIKLRIYAEMKSPAVIIQDNTNGNAEYALVTPSYNITGSTVKDIRALSGWSGTNAAGSYSGTRVAAPFAMLDSVYTITKKIKVIRPTISFPQLKVNWSINNVGTAGDITIGQITTSHYNPNTNQLYILGKLDVDTDEYDNHVIVHEWGHFLEYNLSRSDSKGGSHSFGDEKDMSLAFSEGWGNAVSAMAFDPDVYYSDTSGVRQQSGFQVNLENSTITGITDTHKGWFSEISIQEILYDIYDSTNEAGDNLSLGMGPILDVLTGYQKTTPAATSIFSFIHGLELANSGLTANLNTLLSNKNIAAVTDAYGSGEANNGGWANNLPVSNLINLGGAGVAISLYGNFGVSGGVQNNYYGLYNTVFNNKYLRFTASTASTKLNVVASDTFELDVYNKGIQVGTYHYEHRTSAAAFGPFNYSFPTTAGQEYTVNVLTAQDVIWTDPIVTLTITGTTGP